MAHALLDTDILSEVLKLRNATVLDRALRYNSQYGPLAFSAMTRYEISRGYKSQNATTQLARFATFCQNSLVFPLTDSVFDRASDLWGVARHGGHPRNDADLLIAATALEHCRVLVTGNRPHFEWIKGLIVADWRQPT